MTELAIAILELLAYWKVSLTVFVVSGVTAGLSFFLLGAIDIPLVSIVAGLTFLCSVFYFGWPETKNKL